MDNQKSSSNHRDWIEPLRRNSWEMELLLTGFVLIGLLQLPDFLANWYDQFSHGRDEESLLNYIIGAGSLGLATGVRMITINLMVLLLMRGFWIGMVGLSSSFPEGINTKRLNFAEKFDQKVQASNLNTENLIVKLDVLCSTIFALSFLFFFIAISGGLLFIQVVAISQFHDYIYYGVIEPNGDRFSGLWRVLIFSILGFYVLGILLKLVDFVTIGALKRIKRKWFVRVYYRISQFISIVTLGFLYRSIYYVLASNLNKRIITVILAVYFAIVFVLFVGFDVSKEFLYYPGTFRDQFELSYSEYENLRPEDYSVINNAIIQSDVINGSYVRLFIPYEVAYNEDYKAHCPELKYMIETTSSNFQINVDGESIFGELEIKKEDVAYALDCLSSFYRISVGDSTYTDLKFLFYRHPKHDVPGLITNIPVKHLDPGYYELEILRAETKTPNMIQFWKE